MSTDANNHNGKNMHFAEYVCSRIGIDFNKNVIVGYEVVVVNAYEPSDSSAIFETRELAEKYAAEIEKMRKEPESIHRVRKSEWVEIHAVEMIKSS